MITRCAIFIVFVFLLGCKTSIDKQVAKYFPEPLIDVTLPKTTQGFDLSKVEKQYTSGFMLIGSNLSNQSRNSSKTDSIYIQVNDVLITLDHIPGYINSLKAFDAPRVAIFLFADRKTPQDFVNRLVKGYPQENIPIFFVVNSDPLQVHRCR